MYSATRNCTEPRVDGAAHEVLFVLEICSELMLPLASLIQCFARPAPGYPSANPLPINGPCTGTIAYLQSEAPLPFDLVNSFKMSFANHLPDGCNVFPFFSYGADA